MKNKEDMAEVKLICRCGQILFKCYFLLLTMPAKHIS